MFFEYSLDLDRVIIFKLQDGSRLASQLGAAHKSADRAKFITRSGEKFKFITRLVSYKKL